MAPAIYARWEVQEGERREQQEQPPRARVPYDVQVIQDSVTPHTEDCHLQNPFLQLLKFVNGYLS